MIPLGYFAIFLSHGDPAVLDPQFQHLHVVQQSTDGVDVGVGQLIALVLGLGGSWFGQTTRSPYPHYVKEISITSLASSLNPSGSKSLGHFCSQSLRTGLSTSSSTASVLVQNCCPGDVQGTL